MWPKLITRRRSSNIKTNDEKLTKTHKSFNVNDEYLSALRTESYVEIFRKAQSFIKGSSSFKSHCKFSETILQEPAQEPIFSVLMEKELPEFKTLLIEFFEITAQASNLCFYLLKTIEKTHYHSRFIQQSFDSIQNCCSVSELTQFFNSVKNPFLYPDKNEFKLIHDECSLIFRRLNCVKKKVATDIRLLKLIKRSCGLVAIRALVFEAHPMVMGSSVFSFLSHPLLKLDALIRVRDQLDSAAKGIYILNVDFDTTSRLVARLDDAIEDNAAIVRLYLEKRDDRSAIVAAKELRRRNVGLGNQVEELREHLCLCLVTINRARRALLV